ncbi:MAG TPA: sugar phosphate isomerase/epimerase, partial [Methanoregulaceae archaeon]|nr:sugar phosphate isomerase/epimerase [Methanoregulaceae archaeon]
NMGDWDYFLLKRPEEIPLIGDCGFTLDVGHANQNHCLTEFLEIPACHYHLHDNDGTADSHDAAGTGTIRFPEVMAAVRRSGVTPVIEVATLEGTLESIWVLEAL